MLTIPKIERIKRQEIVTQQSGEHELDKSAKYLIRQIKKLDITISSQKWWLSRYNDILYGSIDITPEGPLEDIIKDDHIKYSISLVFSKGKVAYSLGCGLRFNGSLNIGMLGVEYRKKYCKNFNLKHTVEESVDCFVMNSTTIFKQYEQLKNYKLDRKTAYYLILQAANKKLMPFTACKKVLHTFLYPRHEQLKDKNAFSLYAAFAIVAKGFPPNKQLVLFRELYRIMKKELKLEL